MTKNPYPETLIDEVSGIEVLGIRHQLWEEGYRAGKEDGKVIKDERIGSGVRKSSKDSC